MPQSIVELRSILGSAWRHRSMRLVTLLVLAIALVGLLLQVSKSGKFSRPQALASHAKSDLINVALGKTVLQIPAKYFSRLPSEERGATQFILWALLPDLTPLVEERQANTVRPKWGKKVQILVSYKFPEKLLRESFPIMLTDSGRTENKKLETSGGFTKFNWSGFEVLFTGPVTSPSFVIICSPVDPPKGASAQHWSPTCSQKTHIGEEIYVDWDFSRDYLPQVSDIERKLVSKLNEFRVSGLALEAMP